MELLYSDNLLSAFVAEIVRAFQQHHRGNYLGRTALQKLAYFCQATGVPVPASFEIYNYGPYSDTITFTVESMLADDVLRDVSRTTKYSNYKLSTPAVTFPADLQRSVSSHLPQINRVVKALGGFKPDQLELIATLHFIASRRRSFGFRVSEDDIEREFFQIKGDKFSTQEVKGWYKALESAGLLAA